MQKWVLAALAAITAVAAAANVNACFGYGCHGYYNDYDYVYNYAEPGVYYVPYAGGSCWGYACGYGYYPRYAYGGYAYSYSYAYNYDYGYGNYGYNSHYDAGYHAQLANYCANGWC